MTHTSAYINQINTFDHLRHIEGDIDSNTGVVVCHFDYRNGRSVQNSNLS